MATTTTKDINIFLQAEIVRLSGYETGKVDHNTVARWVDTIKEKASHDKVDIKENQTLSERSQSGIPTAGGSERTLAFEEWLKTALEEAQKKNPGKLPGDVAF